MKKIFFIIIFLLFAQSISLGETFEDLQKIKKTSYLDFILLKIEQRLVQRHSLLGSQPMALRVQYQSVISQVDFSEKDLKIIVSVIGVMDKKRYSQKKYKPKISDCNVLRNILVYGKYGYNLIFQKRNKYLTNEDMENIFFSRYLNNLSLSVEEKEYIVNNTLAKIEIIDPVRGNDIFCSGKIIEDLK
tara:strand:- start:1638 stop:2201 length:564 start_codon:yes stop_codon:yes gene_type:complete